MADQDLHRRNLESFRTFLPDVHKLLTTISCQGEVVGASGSFNLLLGGAPVYQGDADRAAREQLENFWASRAQVTMSVPDERDLDPHARRLLKRLRTRMEADGLTPGDAIVTRRSYYLIIFGIGLARHFDALIEDTDCRTLIVADVLPEMLYYSTFTYDWAGLFERFERQSRTVKILLSDAPRTIAGSLRQYMRSHNPVSLDGMVIFRHYDVRGLKEAHELFRNRELSLVPTAGGYFEDELHMVLNTHGNLSSGKALLVDRMTEPISLPVVLVASGPSLDEHMETIRNIQDRAIIVSCGSPIPVLIEGGVRPDFQVLLERADTIYAHQKHTAERHDLSGICLVATSTIYPKARELFDRTVFFFRPGLTPFLMFCEDESQVLANTGSEVVNAALSFAQHVGFRDILFFGTDLGVTSPDKERASKSWKGTWDEQRPRTYEIEMPGTGGGTVYTNHPLLLVKAFLETAIAGGPADGRYRNCSGGLNIEGAPYTPPGEDIVGPPATDKRAVVEAVVNKCKPYPKRKFDKAWKSTGLVRTLPEFAGRLAERLARFDLNDNGAVAELMSILALSAQVGRTDELLPQFFRGSLSGMLVVGEYYRNRLADPDHRKRLAKIFSDECAAVVRDMGEEARTWMEKIEAGDDPSTSAS